MNCQTEKEQKKEIKKRDSTWIPKWSKNQQILKE